MTSAMCLLRPRWRRIDHRIQTFPTVHKRIRGVSARHQPDSSPLIGAWFGLTASFDAGGPLAHPALEMPGAPCQVWTPLAVHVGCKFPLANRSLRIASSALSPPWLALGPSCVDNGLVGLGIRQVATTTICRCPTDRGATLGRVDTGGVLRGTIRLLLSFYQNPMIIYYSHVGTKCASQAWVSPITQPLPQQVCRSFCSVPYYGPSLSMTR